MVEEQTVQTDAAPADSSPAPVTAEAALASLSPPERSTWQETGHLPDRFRVSATPPDVAAESSPAQPEKPAASTEASSAPASEPGPSQDKKGKGVKARSAALDAEIQELQERLRIRRELHDELARLQAPKPDVKPESSPAAQPQARWQRYKSLPNAPKEADFAEYGDYVVAMGDFVAEQRQMERDTQMRVAQAEQAQTQRIESLRKSATERIQAAQEADPEFASKVDPRLLDITPLSALGPQDRVEPWHVLADEVLTSEAVDRLLVHFSTEAGQQEWVRLCGLPPNRLLREFGALEHRLLGGASDAPQVKHVSSAPAPATVLGTRAAEGGDPVEAAIKRRDQAAYNRLMNERELAAMHG